jgi:hypothetical protein
MATNNKGTLLPELMLAPDMEASFSQYAEASYVLSMDVELMAKGKPVGMHHQFNSFPSSMSACKPK